MHVQQGQHAGKEDAREEGVQRRDPELREHHSPESLGQPVSALVDRGGEGCLLIVLERRIQ